LEKFARQCGVPFEYTAIAKKWENITPYELALREGEVLAVNCLFRLEHLLNDHVVATNPRKLLLKKIRTMNPKVCQPFPNSINHFMQLYLTLI